MSTYYDRPFQARKWIIAVELTDKQKETLAKTMPKKNCTFIPWPSAFFEEEVLGYANQGYAEYIKPMPFFLNIDLALRAANSLLRKYNSSAQISAVPAYHRSVHNKIEKKEDYVKLMNDILFLNDDITISQVFGIADIEHDFVVSFDAYRPIVQRLTKNAITVGNGSNFDVDITEKSSKDLLTIFSSLFRD